MSGSKIVDVISDAIVPNFRAGQKSAIGVESMSAVPDREQTSPSCTELLNYLKLPTGPKYFLNTNCICPCSDFSFFFFFK